MSKDQIKRVFKKVIESEGKKSVSMAMKEVGYPETTAHNPQRITKSKTWEKLLDQRLSDDKLTEVHSQLLTATRIDHMVFPVNITDEEIIELLDSVNCKSKKIMHSETGNHVWFWSADNKARKEGLDMAYKLKDKYPKQSGNSVVVPVQINFNDEKENYS